MCILVTHTEDTHKIMHALYISIGYLSLKLMPKNCLIIYLYFYWSLSDKDSITK